MPATATFLFRLLCAFLIVGLICPGDALAAKKKRRKSRAPYCSANAAILMESASGKKLFAKHAEKRVYPASTTKVLTAILAIEKLSLESYVTVSARATQVQPTKLDLRPGEQYKVKDLLYAILLKSANDAAVVLAEAVAGSHSEFVSMMNKRAYQIGARNSRFANAHGLPSEGTQFTTAHDMALIFKTALKYEFFRKAITFKYRTMYSKDGRRFFLKSHNKSLFLDWKKNVYGKTGYTRQAQSCFIGHVTHGGKTYIVAVFGCSRRWEDVKFIIERYGKLDL